MLGIDIQASGAAHHQQAGVRTAEDVTQMLEGSAVLGQRVLGPGTKGVDDHIKALQVGGGQIKQVFGDDLAGLRLVLAANHSSHIQLAVQGLLHDPFTGFAIGTDNSDFHVLVLLIAHAFLVRVEQFFKDAHGEYLRILGGIGVFPVLANSS